MKRSSINNNSEKVFRLASTVAAVLAALMVVLIIIFMLLPSLKALVKIPLRELFTTRWNPEGYSKSSWGILPFLAGSLWTTIIALAISIPISFLAAIFSTQFLPATFRPITDLFFSILAGIPSVIMGFLALTAIAPLLAKTFNLPSGLTMLNGGITLAIMVLPTMVSVLTDSFQKIPQIYKEGALALGASKWQAAIGVLFQFVKPAFISSILLSFGRAIGETMAVIMAVGNVAMIPTSPLQPGETMTGALAIEMPEAVANSLHYNALFLIGFILLIIALLVNYLSGLITSKVRVEIQ
ncbi:phosphate ABC transporter permease subunit PstC [Coprothermobacter platensis]|uniref:phosphate ABC transporter permease subunit PstC n=1 Tax=Coprothermobacter platensis TaxID=108819 RepID=UPI0003620EE0|nr:phosphate ABC transporter permease subunit PstC [Coprothermobacter platensis]